MIELDDYQYNSEDFHELTRALSATTIQGRQETKELLKHTPLKVESLESSLRYVTLTRSYMNDMAYYFMGRVQGIWKSRAVVKRLKRIF